MSKKIKKYKVGIDSETYAISMVESPAIESDFVALAEQKEEKVQVFLESDERHMVYGAALIPDKDIYRNNGEQEFYVSFTKESIEKMSQDFMKNYRQNEVTLDHEEMASDITITESWLVEDPYKDKANALGINVPQGTWMVGMKVNQIDVWERIKSGELKGFSVESMISLEEFNKINDKNNIMEIDEMSFWNKMKDTLSEVFTSFSMSKKDEAQTEENEVEAIKAELEENAQPTVEPSEPTVTEPTVTEPTVTEPTVTEPTVETPKVDEPAVVEEPKVEEPKVDEPKVDENTHLEDLVNSLKAEIEALKTTNNELTTKVNDLSKLPSVKPISTVSGNGGANGDAYQAWREKMRSML